MALAWCTLFLNLPSSAQIRGLCFLPYPGASWWMYLLGRASVMEQFLSLQGECKRVEREGTEHVAAHAALHLSQLLRGLGDPVEIDGRRQRLQLRRDVGIAYEFRRARGQGHQILKQPVDSGQQAIGFFLG